MFVISIINTDYLFDPVIIPEEDIPDNDSHESDAFGRGRSMDSIPSTFTNGSCSPNSEFCGL